MTTDADKYTLKMPSARLEMVEVGLHHSLFNGNNQALSTKNAKYPMRRTEIKTFTIPRGDMYVVKENMFTGQMPRKIVIGIPQSDAYQGNCKNARSALKIST